MRSPYTHIHTCNYNNNHSPPHFLRIGFRFVVAAIFRYLFLFPYFILLEIDHLPEAMAPAVSPRANNRLGEVHSLEPYTTPRKHTTKGFITYEIDFFYFTPRLTDRKKTSNIISATRIRCARALFLQAVFPRSLCINIILLLLLILYLSILFFVYRTQTRIYAQAYIDISVLQISCVLSSTLDYNF